MHLSRGHRQTDAGHLCDRRVKTDAVDRKKDQQNEHADALVAVEERMIGNQCVSSAGGLSSTVG